MEGVCCLKGTRNTIKRERERWKCMVDADDGCIWTMIAGGWEFSFSFESVNEEI